jgi:hypothetical protein
VGTDDEKPGDRIMEFVITFFILIVAWIIYIIPWHWSEVEK